MRLSAIDAARKFVKEKFPNSDIAFLAGSASRGEETATSDLDIVIFDNSIESHYRESFVLYNWKIETFIYNYTTYLNQFDVDKESGRPILANMLAEGKIIRDNGKSEEIKDNAKSFIKSGPKPLTDNFIRASRYFIYDLLDDFKDSKNHPEAIMTLNTISTQLADFILRVNRQWVGRGKGLARSLKKFDERIYNEFFESLDCYYKDGDKQPFIKFVNDIYKPFGGPLFNGFSQGK
ncbi:nucleotidyltransferase domain-containing protein [Bacillus sp. FJAT-49711]|uniref:nucleotidyltransferase domain-containing protein n=1 Tax=Bacillus sp. FJAT-49711 TaxID=2833585 RepID=UPI001BC9DBFB|nr:nucleotidyltransferase domain-containing protein [Bacillus sp. FJAT-49711]MBS4220293.1 nucleotidyltransferase domain-containing protein [Bacillus sp. FJAT-49711]